MTQSEYVAFLSRQRPANTSSGSTSSAMATDEGELHSQIIQECARRGWIVFHGSMANRTFRTPGEPDFVILADPSRVFLIECKTRTGKLSTDQQAIAAWATKLGHTIHVVRSIEEFINITKAWVDTGD